MSEINFGDPSPAEIWADRADAFKAARALVDQFDWPEPPSVHDVVQVAMLLVVGSLPDE